MSLRSDGTYRCDDCGLDVGNAAVTECAIVSTIAHTDDGPVVLVLHFCRVPRDGAPEGCAAHLLTPSHLTNYNAS